MKLTNGDSIVNHNGVNGASHSNAVSSHTESEQDLIKPQELVRLMVQAMHDLGYHDSATSLEAESGYMLEPSFITQFREGVLTGDWDVVESLLPLFNIEDDENIETQEVKFLIRQQKYLELLEARNIKKALTVLRNELTPLNYSSDRLHFLSSLMMCSSAEELRRRANLDGTMVASRNNLLSELQRYISPSIMVPEKRLETLLKQAVSLQLMGCLYHNNHNPTITLYADHICDRTQFPCITTKVLEGHSDEVWHVAFSNNGQYLASVSKDRTCIIWNVEDMQQYRKLDGHLERVTFCAWSPDDSMLLICGEQVEGLRLWDVTTGTMIKHLKKHSDQVSSCLWLPDGNRFISGGMDKNIYLWNIEGSVIYTWSADRVSGLAINKEGTRLYAVSQDKSLRAYDLVNKTEIWHLQEKAPITSITISNDSKYALLNLGQCAREIRLYDLEEKTLVHKYAGQMQAEYVIRSCFGGANQAFIVSGSEDNQIYVWNRDHETLMEVLKGHDATVNSVGWNPVNPYMFASASDDRTVRIWGVPTREQNKGKMRMV